MAFSCVVIVSLNFIFYVFVCVFRFLGNFAKRTFTVNDQVKIINDFLGVSIPNRVSNASIDDFV